MSLEQDIKTDLDTIFASLTRLTDLLTKLSGVSGYSGNSGWSGFSGDSGASGYSGTSGDSGASGYSGASGDSGTSGYSGMMGGSGYSGSSGSGGKSGFSGISGKSGYSGSSGKSGYSGLSGKSGYSGFSGASGYSGSSGDSGTSGSSGYSGGSGFSGTSGSNGNSGFSGSNGISGFSGSLGTSGFSGASGYSGLSGMSGFSGTSGVKGISGFSGSTGTSGFSGTSGVKGISGFSGLIGQSGFSGLSGMAGAMGPAGGGNVWINVKTVGVSGAASYQGRDPNNVPIYVGTDDLPALQAAVNSFGPNTHATTEYIRGGTLFLPKGIYLISAPLEVPSYVNIRGESSTSTIIVCTQTDQTKGAIELVSSNQGFSVHDFDDFGIVTTAGYGIYPRHRNDVDFAIAFDGATYTDVTAAAKQDHVEFIFLADANDIFYFGKNTWSGGAGSFHGIFAQFNVPNDVHFAWEYWNGTAWANLAGATDLSYGARAFYTFFTSPADWAPVAVNGSTSMYVRAKLAIGQTPSHPLTMRCITPDPSAVTLRINRLQFSCGSESIFLERAYSQNCLIENCLHENIGAGLVSLVGNVNAVLKHDAEGGNRLSFRKPLAALALQGQENNLRDCIVEGSNFSEVGFYMSGGNGEFTGNHYEVAPGGENNIAYIFEKCGDIFIDRVYGIAPCLTRFWRTTARVAFFGSNEKFSDFINIDPDDHYTRLIVESTHGTYSPGEITDPRVWVKQTYSDFNGVGIEGLHMPRTGNLLFNGNFQKGLYGWNIRAANGASIASQVVEPRPDGFGYRLKVVVSIPNQSTNQIAYLQTTLSLPDTAYSGAPGFISYKAYASGHGQVILYYGGGTGLTRAEGYATARVPCPLGACTIGIVDGQVITFICYGDGNSTCTFYFEDIAVYIGDRYNYVPYIAKTQQWLNGVTEMYGSSAPVGGTWKPGDKVWNDFTATSSQIGWVYSSDNTWHAFGTVS